MATTTNYAWETPDDTDLVKDGAAAIRTLGSSIDTTVFNNSSASIAKTIVDAKGDLIAATAADTLSRLAIGTNGQNLTVDSDEPTGMKWATPGGFAWTSAASANFPTGTNTVTISSLSGKSYLIVINGVTFGGNDLISVRFNGDSGNNYYDVNSNASSRIKLNNTETVSTPTYYSAYVPMANTSAALKVVLNGGTPGSAAAIGGSYRSTSAITSITLKSEGEQNFTGGSYQIWSVQ
jgi:hypothetical protein